MCANSLRIADHFDSLREAREQRLAERRRQVKAIKTRDAALVAEIQQVGDERYRKIELRRQITVEDPQSNTESLDMKLADLDSRLAAAIEERNVCERALADLPAHTECDADRESLLGRLLVECYGCTELREIDGRQGLYRLLELRVECDRANGRPTAVRLPVGGKELYFAVTGADGLHLRSWSPSELDWIKVAESPRRTTNHGMFPRMLAFLDRSTNTLLLSSTQLNWFEEQSVHGGYGTPRPVPRTEDFADIATNFVNELEVEAGDAKGIVDLASQYPSNGLLERIRGEVLALCSDGPSFKPCSDALGTRDIEARIKKEWTAFVASPWSGDTTGTMALLKYLAENGERPRFWCGPYEGHYLFRLRTRDHSWIRGEVYLDTLPEPTPTAPISTVHARLYSETVAIVGRLRILVSRSLEN